MTVLKMRPKLGHIFANAAQMVTKRPVYRLVTMMVTSNMDKELPHKGTAVVFVERYTDT